MSLDLSKKLVVAVSARALFDLEEEHFIFEKEGLEAYCAYQLSKENEVLRPGPAFQLVKALQALNELEENKSPFEIVLVSHNRADCALRIFYSISHYGLSVTRSVLTGGSSLIPYLQAFQVKLFLTASEKDAQEAVDAGIPAGAFPARKKYVFKGKKEDGQLKIAFDGDAVLFSDESELIFKKEGLEAFEEHEKEFADSPMKEGPMAAFLKALSKIQDGFAQGSAPVRTALVTSRCAPAHERVVKTLRAWDVRIDEAFFLGGISKRDVLKAFDAHVFFDDQWVHIGAAARVVPAARVPCKRTG